ncbi:MAG TPA: hypothetical protein VFV33_11345 [Gemmatimonadaceae bacterium]|nr:hypothetical protein [Gemmatimonadaceae bacterium]
MSERDRDGGCSVPPPPQASAPTDAGNPARIDTAPRAPAPPAGGGGGLNDYLAGMSMLEGAVTREGPARLSAAEVRRHTGSMQALPSTDARSRRPTTGHMAAVQGSGAIARRATTGRMPAVQDAKLGGRVASGYARTVEATPPARSPLRRFLLPAIAVGLGLVAVVPTVFVATAPPVVPPALLGEWSTDRGIYAERRLVFTSEAVGIRTLRNGPPEFFPIRAVAVTPIGDVTRVVVTYAQDDEPVALQLQLSTTPTRRLVLANPPDLVWYPVGERPRDPAPSPATDAGAVSPVPGSDGAAPVPGDGGVGAANSTGAGGGEASGAGTGRDVPATSVL